MEGGAGRKLWAVGRGLRPITSSPHLHPQRVRQLSPVWQPWNPAPLDCPHLGISCGGSLQKLVLKRVRGDPSARSTVARRPRFRLPSMPAGRRISRRPAVRLGGLVGAETSGDGPAPGWARARCGPSPLATRPLERSEGVPRGDGAISVDLRVGRPRRDRGTCEWGVRAGRAPASPPHGGDPGRGSAGGWGRAAGEAPNRSLPARRPERQIKSSERGGGGRRGPRGLLLRRAAAAAGGGPREARPAGIPALIGRRPAAARPRARRSVAARALAPEDCRPPDGARPRSLGSVRTAPGAADGHPKTRSGGDPRGRGGAGEGGSLGAVGTRQRAGRSGPGLPGLDATW